MDVIPIHGAGDMPGDEGYGFMCTSSDQLPKKKKPLREGEANYEYAPLKHYLPEDLLTVYRHIKTLACV